MSVSLVLRRTHMYVALFLSPWVLMYALSTMFMNHRSFFEKDFYDDAGSSMVVEREFTYEGSFPRGTDADAVSEILLQNLGLSGSHGTRGTLEDTITINRHALTVPRQVTYEAATGRVVVRRREYRTNEFLERFHRRRGYGGSTLLNDIWAVSVDIFIVAMLVWAGTGLWMWWEMSVTRKVGALCLLGSALVFTFFLVTI